METLKNQNKSDSFIKNHLKKVFSSEISANGMGENEGAAALKDILDVVSEHLDKYNFSQKAK